MCLNGIAIYLHAPLSLENILRDIVMKILRGLVKLFPDLVK